MKIDFHSIRASIQRKFENVLIEIMQTTNPDGFLLLVDDKPIIKEFNKLMDSAEGCYLGSELVCIKGEKGNED